MANTVIDCCNNSVACSENILLFQATSIPDELPTDMNKDLIKVTSLLPSTIQNVSHKPSTVLSENSNSHLTSETSVDHHYNTICESSSPFSSSKFITNIVNDGDHKVNQNANTDTSKLSQRFNPILDNFTNGNYNNVCF